MKKDKEKKTIGFKLGITHAIIWLLFAVVFFCVAVYFFSLSAHSKSSYIGFLEMQNGGTYIDGFDELGAAYGYVSADSESDDYNGTPYLELFIEDRTDEEYGEPDHSGYRYEYYDFVFEDMNGKTWVFAHRETGEEITVDFNQTRESYNYEHYLDRIEYYANDALIFIIIGTALTLISVFLFIAAFKGGKSHAANTFGIALNSVLLPVLGISAIGLAGAIKDRKIAAATDEKYIKKKRLEERAAENMAETTESNFLSAVAKADKNAGGGQTAEAKTGVNAKTVENIKDVPLKIISIPDKEWKEYREKAQQDELFVLGTGMKLWLAQTRIKALCYTIGLLLSVIIGLVILFCANVIAGAIILALGYLVFCSLCMRGHFIRTTLNQTKRKLTADNRKALDAEFKAKGGAAFADVFISVVLLILSEPYNMALALISAVLPSVLNTKLVIPEGFGFEALEEIKRYYAERSFLSETIDILADHERHDARKYASNTSPTPTDEYYKKSGYTYTDEHGYEQTVFSDNGKDFYDDGDRCVGHAVDEKTVEIRGNEYKVEKNG